MAPNMDNDSPPSSPNRQEDEVMEEVEEDYDEENAEEDENDENEVVVSADKIEIIAGANSDQTAMTFCFKEEDHTLGNSLRHVINKNPEVDFCGYSIPHPSEAKMNVRIQTSDNTTAIDALSKGLTDLHDMCAFIRQAYEEELAKKEYVVWDEKI
ncbi:RNA polymerase subunit AC19 [Apophysomyces sp. BC1034]|nr:RNA polymerase subunit AC19 [Apophysomyces sp. BC1015]KAG0175954.1 RNA polymerase subunit AC19 [Apophysomyces sp. BC1021]KAG0185947.1 RNA polymerase subunit AC19 [Apophysomyces sp. BC1034]